MIHLDLIDQDNPALRPLVDELRRLRAHIIAEYRNGDISEGRASELLDLDRFTLRQLCGVYQTEDGPVDDTIIEGPPRKIKLVREQVLDAARELAQGSKYQPPTNSIAARLNLTPGAVSRHINRLRQMDAWPFVTKYTGRRPARKEAAGG